MIAGGYEMFTNGAGTDMYFWDIPTEFLPSLRQVAATKPSGIMAIAPTSKGNLGLVVLTKVELRPADMKIYSRTGTPHVLGILNSVYKTGGQPMTVFDFVNQLPEAQKQKTVASIAKMHLKSW